MAPFTVLEKLIFPPDEIPPLVVSKVGLFVRDTGPVIVMNPPFVIRFDPMLIAVVLAAIKLARGVTLALPTCAENVMAPDPACTLRA